MEDVNKLKGLTYKANELTTDSVYSQKYSENKVEYGSIEKYDQRKGLFHGKDSMLPKRIHHKYISKRGNSLEEVLRKLEKSANLPEGDIEVDIDKGNLTGEYKGRSKTVDKSWTSDINNYKNSEGKIRLGYIICSVYENNWNSYKNTVLDSLEQPISSGISGGDTVVLSGTMYSHLRNYPKFSGYLLVSENCPGIFKYDKKAGYDRCTTCGEKYPRKLLGSKK